jgi:hypothetical protein
MVKLTEQNIIELLGCPKDWDIPAIFEEIHLAYCLDSSHYKTIEGVWTVTIINAFTYEWKAGQVHSERLYCYETYKVTDEMCNLSGKYEDLDLEIFVIENCPLISTEYYI